MKHFDELQETSKQLEFKYNQLIENEELIKKENDELREKNEFLENEILTIKSSQSHHQDLQINIEKLQSEIERSVCSLILFYSNLIFVLRSKNVKMLRSSMSNSVMRLLI